jgi:hypothetical protein
MTQATPSMPNIIAQSYATSSADFLKPATVDLILDDASVPIDLMTNLIFEQIGGQELISISRHDMLNGQDVSYNPISNMSSIALRYNSRSLIPVSGSSDEIFKNYQIDIDPRIPDGDDQLPYIDAATGDIVINVQNMDVGEEVEVQVISSTNLSSY